MRLATIFSLPLALALFAGCAAPTDDTASEEAVSTSGSSALTAASGLYSITPIPIPDGRPVYDAISVDWTGIYYLSYRLTGYSAVHIDFSGKILAESALFVAAAPKYTRNMVVTNGSVMFGDGDKTVVLPLDPKVAPSSKLACGSGYVCGNIAKDTTSGRDAYWRVGTSALENVAPTLKFLPAVSTCDVSKLGASYASQVTSATDATSGTIHVAGRLSDGRVVDCRGTVTGATARVVALPFKSAGEISFEGGGGIGFEGGGGIGVEGGGGINFDPGGGIYVASGSTPELAVISADGSSSGAIALTTAAPGTTAYAGSIPRHVRTTGKSAVVLTADRRLLLVKP